MISKIELERTQRADVYIEHPDDWSDAQLKRAVSGRVADLMNAACWWDSPIIDPSANVKPGVDDRESLDSGDKLSPPLVLDEESLTVKPPVVTIDHSEGANG